MTEFDIDWYGAGNPDFIGILANLSESSNVRFRVDTYWSFKLTFSNVLVKVSQKDSKNNLFLHWESLTYAIDFKSLIENLRFSQAKSARLVSFNLIHLNLDNPWTLLNIRKKLTWEELSYIIDCFPDSQPYFNAELTVSLSQLKNVNIKMTEDSYELLDSAEGREIIRNLYSCIQFICKVDIGSGWSNLK